MTVGKWRRHVVSLTNGSYAGNPFELEVDGTFTHTATGTTLTLPGYYSGNNTWKIGFMPTRTGGWTYLTSSSDADLDNKTGAFTAVDSGLPGLLQADPAHPRKWQFADGPHVVPIALRMEFFSEPASLSAFTAVANFMAANEIHLLETRLIEENGQFGGRHDFIFAGDWRNHQLDLAVWDRMEERMEALAQRGLGAHIMFYSDDAGKPGWSGRSATEALMIRYTVARLAGYPVLLFNTGIDIKEYRNQGDVDWFGQQIRALDPYDHPVSSRYGGGSGEFVMSGQTFDSRGDPEARIGDMTSYFQAAGEPVSMDDAWRETTETGNVRNHTAADVRRAFWKCVVAGGLGGLIRGQNWYFYISSLASDLESEQWLRLINPFVRGKLGSTFGTMVPVSSLGSNAYALADPARSKILYFIVGASDGNDGGGGGITLSLGGLSGGYGGIWFDPRTGTESVAGTYAGGTNHAVNPPTNDDWVLLLTSATAVPDLGVTPAPVDFGTMIVGYSVDQAAIVSNEGSAPLTIALVSTVLTPEFELIDENCSGVVLPPGGSCAIDFTFSPSAAAPYLDDVLIHSDDPDTPLTTVDLVGVGSEPCSAQDDVIVGNQTFTGTTVVEACQTVTLAAGLVVASGAEVTFRAGSKVIFADGIEVRSGGMITVVIDPLLTL